MWDSIKYDKHVNVEPGLLKDSIVKVGRTLEGIMLAALFQPNSAAPLQTFTNTSRFVLGRSRRLPDAVSGLPSCGTDLASST